MRGSSKRSRLTLAAFLLAALSLASACSQAQPHPDAAQPQPQPGQAFETYIFERPQALTNATVAEFAFAVSGATQAASFECQLDGSAFAACRSPVSVNPFGEGQHVFAVRAVVANQIDATPASAVWVVDTVPPNVTLDLGPSAVTHLASAVFEFSAGEFAYFLCGMDDATPEPCESPHAEIGLPSGERKLTVYARDAVGNSDATPLEVVWIIDLPPGTSFLSSPETVDDSPSVGFDFFGIDDFGIAGYECSLDKGAFTACASPYQTPMLALGEHHFAVRAVDNRGQIDATPAEITWATIPEIPETVLVYYPPAYTPLTTVVLRAESPTANFSHFICSIDNGPFGDCGASLNYVTAPGERSARFAAVNVNAVSDATLDDSTATWTVLASSGPAWVTVAAGDQHACAIRDDGSLWCWGAGSAGRLGLGSTEDITLPTRVGAANDWSDIAVGGQFSCGIRNDSDLFCWGQNLFGQVGVNDEGSSQFLTPQAVSDAVTWTTVVAGAFHACALASDGKAWCWGYNGDPDATIPALGRLGLGSNQSIAWAPTPTAGGASYLGLSAGNAHTCAIRSAAIDCWGANDSGQIGDGASADALAPQTISAGTWLSLAAGGNHSCAAKLGGQLYCWGAGAAGQLGNANLDEQLSPVSSASGIAVSEVVAGANHTCARSYSGDLYCFGGNFYGQLGFKNLSDDGFAAASVSTPTQIGQESKWLRLGGAAQGTCGIREANTLWCWGNGLFLPFYSNGSSFIPAYFPD